MVVSGVLDNVPWNALDNIHAALYASMESKGVITVAEALVVLTGATVWTMKDGSPHPTGFWAREFIEAHDAFTDGG